MVIRCLTASGSPSSSSSSDEEGWQDDVAEDLNTFVRLSKAGHFTRAEDFFCAFLENHAGDFAVAAQYAENLIEQGSFGCAEGFLTAWLSKNMDADDEERTVLRLLLDTARIYTQFEERDSREAAENAAICLRSVGYVIIAEDMSPLKLQTIAISLRLMDLVSRTPGSESFIIDENTPKLPPFRLDCKPDQDPIWEEVIIALLNHGHIWEANTLLAIHLRRQRPGKSELFRILSAVPEEDDTMYTLVRLTMLVSCSRFLLRKSWKVLMTSGVFDRCEALAQNSFYSAMDGITYPIASSRAYQDFRLLSLEVENKRLQSTGQLNTSSLSNVLGEMEDIRERGIDDSDYMLHLSSYEQSSHPLPDHWLHSTGASRDAVECLHKNAYLIPRCYADCFVHQAV